MSTDHQQYSTENQHAAIERFAGAHGIEIVRSFVDSGKSGVGIQGRDALQDLLRVVESGQADFSTILVYRDIAESTGLQKRQAKRAVKALVGAQLIRSVPRNDESGRQTSNGYEFIRGPILQGEGDRSALAPLADTNS